LTRKLQYFLTSLFIIGWLFLFSPNFANANEPPAPSEQVVVSPAQAAVNTALATAVTEVAQASQASDTATAANNALIQSFAQTETWFAWHDNVLQRVYQTILDMAQYIELQKPTSTLNYLNSELENVFLRVSKNELLHELFVFVSSYAEDKVTLEQLKQLAQPAMQNGAELSEMVDLFTANSERSLRKTLGDVQKRKEAIRQQDQALKQQELQQQQEQFHLHLLISKDTLV
jgi:hypothetical protein